MRNPTLNMVIILAAILLLVLAAFLFFSPSSSAQVTAMVSTEKNTYTSGEPVAITLRLRNEGSSATCVSTFSAGSVKVVSIKRDGSEIATRTAPSYFLIPFSEMLKTSLTPLAPGESIDIVFTSDIDDGLGGQAFRTTSSDDDRGLTTFYSVQTPGQYQLELRYEYSGPESPECPNVFAGNKETLSVAFTVNP